MKIAFVHLNRYSEIGSTDFYALSQATGRVLPNSVSVVVARFGESQRELAGSVDLHEIPVVTKHVWTKESIRFYREAAEKIIQLRPDVVSCTFDRGAAVVPVLVRQRLGRRSPLFLHHICSVSFAPNPLRYRIGNFLTRTESAFFDVVTTLSQEVAEEIYGRKCKKPIRIVPIGINAERFATRVDDRSTLRAQVGVGERQTVFVYAGTISAARGCQTLIPAFEAAVSQGTDAHLWIFGDGDQSVTMQQQARNSPCGERIRLFGRMPHEDVARMLPLADVGLCHLPARSRHFLQPPIKILEYMASNLVPLATDVPGNRFYINHGKNGYLYAGDDRSGSALAQAMWQLGNDILTQASMRMALSNTVDEYAWDAIASRWITEVSAELNRRCV